MTRVCAQVYTQLLEDMRVYAHAFSHAYAHVCTHVSTAVSIHTCIPPIDAHVSIHMSMHKSTPGGAAALRWSRPTAVAETGHGTWLRNSQRCGRAEEAGACPLYTHAYRHVDKPGYRHLYTLVYRTVHAHVYTHVHTHVYAHVCAHGYRRGVAASKQRTLAPACTCTEHARVRRTCHHTFLYKC